MSNFFPNPSSSPQALTCCKNDTQIIEKKSCENENKKKLLEYVSSLVFTDDDSSDSDDDFSDSDQEPLDRPIKQRRVSSSSDSDDYSSDSDEEPLDRPIKQRRVSSSSENLKRWLRYVNKGEKVEMTSLLCSSSRNFLVNSEGDEIEVSSIQGKGKYTLIHCCELPVNSYSTLGRVCWALKHVFSKCSDFQFVVVPKVSKGWNEGSELLKSFLAAFQAQSSSCLAVPIWDSVSYDRISGFIKEAVLLDPNGVVLQRDSECIMRYGAESFPFTDDRLAQLFNNGYNMVDERPVRIENLLGLPLSATMFNAAGDTVSVSQLKDKLVGLYLCRDGGLMDSINQRCQYCKANSLELVIVLVYLPLSDDPSHFMACTNSALRKKGISSWWLSLFKDSVSRRLWQIYEHSSWTRERDELIMVGPGGEYLDYLSAANIFYSGSIKDMYPYAAEALARQETERLKKLTLDSFLSLSVNCSLVCSKNGRGIPLDKLQGKTVCLFIANCDDGHFDDDPDEGMTGWCEENANGNRPNFELVFVPLHMHSSNNLNSDPRMSWLWDSTMSWLICPPDPVCEASIIKHTTLRGLKLPELSFLTFGEDGKLLSIACPDLVGDFPTIQLYEEVLESYTDRFSEEGDIFY